ncbi:MAG TPA: response regulator transcription factor [Anaerolineae bacterium]
MIRLLLVDDQPMVRQGWRMRLALEADIAVVGEASNGIEAIQQAQSLNPDVILLDVEMPLMDGLTAAEKLQELTPACAVVMISMYDTAATLERARAAGVAAFVGKQEPTDALLAAIRQAAAAPSL